MSSLLKEQIAGILTTEKVELLEERLQKRIFFPPFRLSFFRTVVGFSTPPLLEVWIWSSVSELFQMPRILTREQRGVFKGKASLAVLFVRLLHPKETDTQNSSSSSMAK
uniref:Uncharacterized protein n=1 Tax=Micrurus lemniscatus lemniscatus TaxID=129467 RepID=A0A2D4IN82_MICLE